MTVNRSVSSMLSAVKQLTASSIFLVNTSMFFIVLRKPLNRYHFDFCVDKGSYETLTYFLNRTMAELWRRKHGGQLYERELEPPYWRAAKPEAPRGGGRYER